MIKLIKLMIKLVLDLLFILPVFLASALTRFFSRPIDVGLGPEPLISNLYHKKALEKVGYSAETFVIDGNHITNEFDYNAGQNLVGFLKYVRWHCLFFRALFRYRCLYFSFHGGPLFGTILLRQIEPQLLWLAGIKTVILPYGGDVQDMTRCPNIAFTAALARDYPSHRLDRKRIARQIDRWTRHAEHVVTGCDWVDYMYYWDSVTLNSFSIDTDLQCSIPRTSDEGTIKILHSPNHRTIKGTAFFEKAVKSLRDEGLDVELIVLEKATNEEVRRVMSQVDIVADQLIIGWYAMFAMEGMVLGKPVLCYIRPELKKYYQQEGLLEDGELPLVECSPHNVTDILRTLVSDRKLMNEIGMKSREFVVKHHSLQVIGSSFEKINRSIGLDLRTKKSKS